MVTNRSRAFSDETLGKMNIKRIIRYRFSRYEDFVIFLDSSMVEHCGEFPVLLLVGKDNIPR